MALYVYIKENNSIRRKTINYFSYLFLTAGSLLLFWSFYPIISFEIYSKLFFQATLTSPLPKTELVSSLELANSVLGTSNTSSELGDFTQANLWFPASVGTSSGQKPEFKAGRLTENNSNKSLSGNEYILSIPKLNITQAMVTVGGNDLKKTLVHYLPKSMPGEYGNVVIFGHSTLPQLYNTKDYKTIFTYLPSLEKGDKIMVNFENMQYEYEVYEMFVVEPDQISVLEPRLDNAYLTLITCVPPGTYWKRLVVRAKLSQLPSN